MFGYLLGVHIPHVPKKRMVRYLQGSWWRLCPDGNDVVCKTIGIGNIRMRLFDGQVRTLTNARHVPDFVARFGSSRVQVYMCRWMYQSYRGLHNDYQRRKNSKLVQVNKNNYCWWFISSNGEGGYCKTLAHAYWIHKRARSSSPTQQRWKYT